MLDTFLKTALNDLEDRDLKRTLCCVEGSQGREILVGGRKVLNFCSNNYLGLANDPRLGQAAVACIKDQGWGAGASRLVCGNLSAHRRLEKELARFKGTQKSLVFSTGYMANVGSICALFNRHDIIFSDRLNHASIVDGILLSQAVMKRYPHGDMDALEGMLRSSNGKGRKVIITDSVFSMDGDIAPLDRIVELAERYQCMVMIDEAHALGVLGKDGKGAAQHFSVTDKIDIQMGTFSKAAGSFGAYVCGSARLIDFLINKARSFIYTTGMPPAVAAASSEGLKIITEEPQLRRQLWENTRYLLKGLKQMGFDTLNTQTPIIPVMVKDARAAAAFSQKLFEERIFVPAIRPPTVPLNTARLRVTVMATHTKDDLDYVLGKFKMIKEESGIPCLI